MFRHEIEILQGLRHRRIPEKPDWLFLPKLHLLLGWGQGLWDLPNLMSIRHAFFLQSVAQPTPPIESVLDCRRRHFEYSPQRGTEPPIVIEGSGMHTAIRYELNAIGRVEEKHVRCPGDIHVIVPGGEYAVRHDPLGDDVGLSLCRRVRTLKPQFQGLMKTFGLVYEPGVGKRGAKPDGQRTPQEQEFAEWMSKFKAQYIEGRVPKLMKDPAARPADFDALRLAHIRSRLGAIQRGKRDSTGKPHRPYTDDALLRVTCGEVAGREATEQMFDASWTPVISYSSKGFSTSPV